MNCLELLSEALEASVEIHSGVFYPVLAALAHHEKDHEFRRLQQSMQLRQLEVDLISLSSTISDAGDWDRALHLLQHMQLQSQDSSSVADSALGFARKGRAWQQAAQHLVDACVDGRWTGGSHRTSPGRFGFTCGLQASVESSHWQKGLQLWEDTIRSLSLGRGPSAGRGIDLGAWKLFSMAMDKGGSRWSSPSS